MNKYKTHILAIDPSGNFHEGKGTTGWVLMDTTEKLIARGLIMAKDFNSAEEYWDAHIDLLQYNFDRHNDVLMVIIEDYQLYSNRAENQINSRMETCRLIGLLQWYCWSNRQAYKMENASVVKTRWSDEILINENILFKEPNETYIHAGSGLILAIHTRDALRHALHFIRCVQEKPVMNTPKPKPHSFSNYPNQEVYDEQRPNYKTGYRKRTSPSRTNRNNTRYSQN